MSEAKDYRLLASNHADVIEGDGRFAIWTERDDSKRHCFLRATWKEILHKKVEIDDARRPPGESSDWMPCEIFDLNEDDGGSLFPVMQATEVFYDAERDVFYYDHLVEDIDGSLGYKAK